MVLLEVLDELLELIKLFLLLLHQIFESLLLQLNLLLKFSLDGLLIGIMRVLYATFLLLKLLLHLTLTLQEVIELLLLIPLYILDVAIQLLDGLVSVLRLQMELHFLLHRQLINLFIGYNALHPS